MNHLDDADDELDLLTNDMNDPTDFLIEGIDRIMMNNRHTHRRDFWTPPPNTDTMRRNKKDKTKTKHKSRNCKESSRV